MEGSKTCECGCGQPTRVVNGRPNRFLIGHSGHKFTRPDGSCGAMGSKIEARQRQRAWKAARARLQMRKRSRQERELAAINRLAIG